MSVREFKSADYDHKPPLPFRLDGEEFLLPGDLPGTMLLRIGEAAVHGEEGMSLAGAQMLNAFQDAMEAAEWVRFRDYIAARPHDLHAGVLGDIMSWWLAAVGERPTVPSPSSQGGRRSTEAGSTDDSPSPDST